ncbi:MAG: LPP20 family lipoprotein [Treponema sp.]|nr:LPP20 family lipoprotein [Treponema sp.]
MKKINVLFVAVIAMALMMSCGGTPEPAPAPVAQGNSPTWLNERPPVDVFWGIGDARLQNESLARQTATNRARRAVAEEVNVQIQGMMTDYAGEAGLINDSRSIQAIENITRTVVNNSISGATVNRQEQMPDGTWWVRVEMRKADARGQYVNAVNNEAADFAEFMSARALDQLDHQLQQQSTPRIVSTD